MKKRLIYCLTFMLVLSGISPVMAQILNADKFGKRTSEKGFTGNISLGFSAKKESTTLLSFNGATNTTVLFRKDMLIGVGRFGLVKNDDSFILNGGFAHARYRINYKKWISPEFFVQYQWNQVRGLENRFLAGGNVRFRILDKPVKFDETLSNYIYVGQGLFYEREMWIDKTVENDESELFKLPKTNTYLAMWFHLNQTVSYRLMVYLQMAIDDHLFDPRVFIDTDLKFKINDKLAISFNFTASYDEIPQVPIDRYFYSFRNNLVWEF